MKLRVVAPGKKTFYQRFVKRPLDFLLSLLGLALLWPLILLLSLLILIKLGKPVLFRQKRPGFNEKIFTIYKFRTMSNERDENGELLPDNMRLKSFGKFLRKSSLDELPELLNILKGEMSFVGPRPLSVLYLPLYKGEEKLRHTVRPGLTGFSQIMGRNTVDWEERFAYDVEYVKNISFINDLKIFFKTFSVVLKSDGIVVSGTGKVIDFDEYRKPEDLL